MDNSKYILSSFKKEDEINICDLLVRVGFASSKGEAKRMIKGNGVKLNSKTVNDISKTIITKEETKKEEDKKEENIIQFGKNKFKKVIKG